jgi:hypothetical protein
MKKIKNKWPVILMTAFFAVNFILLIWYLFIGYKGFFHSDSAAKVLIAREIYDSGNFFPSAWNYVNGDLFIIFGHLFIIPLLAIMPANYTTHAISGLFFSSLILYGVWITSKIADISSWRRIGIVAIVAAGLSGFMAEQLYGQVSYGSIFLISLFTIYFAIKYVSSDHGGKKYLILIGAAIFLAFWASPKRALVSYAFPLLFSILWLMYTTNRPKKNLYNLLSSLLIGIVAGAIANKFTMMQVTNVQGASNGIWLPYELITRNIGLTFKGIYAQLGGLAMENQPIFSIHGLYGGVRLIAATLFIAAVPIAIYKVINGQSEKLKFFGLYAGFSIAITLFFQLTTSIPDMSDPIQSSRYLVPGVMLCLLLVLMAPIEWNLKPPLYGISVTFIAFMFLTAGYLTYKFSGLSSQTLAQPGQINKDRTELIDFLNEKKLRYGYASYWNANTISVLSDELIRIRPVVMQNGLPAPMKHLSSNSWYQPSAWNGETFLLLTNKEAEQFNLNHSIKIGLPIKITHSFKDFKIFVFEQNIANQLTNWDTKFLKQKSFPASALSLSQTGKLTSDGHAPSMLIAEPGDVGALHFGPYITMDPGKYLVTFDVLADYHKNGSVRLDVAAAPDQKIFGELLLNQSEKPQQIKVELDTQRIMEFRVWALGNSNIKFKNVTVERVTDK